MRFIHSYATGVKLIHSHYERVVQPQLNYNCKSQSQLPCGSESHSHIYNYATGCEPHSHLHCESEAHSHLSYHHEAHSKWKCCKFQTKCPSAVMT